MFIYSGISLDTNITIENNIFNNSSRGIRFYGETASSLEGSNKILNNQFNNQYDYPIYLDNQDAPMIVGNTITTNSTLND